MSRPLGLPAAEAYVLGGILGSGVFSVLGVVVRVADGGAWLAYLLAGAVALCTSYAYVRLNAVSDFHGGAVTLVLEHLGRPAFAGVVAWTLLTGFVGLLATYGYAFGAYAQSFLGVATIGGLPARPLLSVLVIAVFVAINWSGPTESGVVETTIVGLNVVLAGAFAVAGLWHVDGSIGVALVPAAGPSRILVAASLAFVSLVAWQILMYDQSRLQSPAETVEQAVLLALPVAVVGYGALSAVVVELVQRAQVARRPELLLAFAAASFSNPVVSAVVALVALSATAAAVNALLFGTTLFLESLVSYRLFPDAASDAPPEAVPRLPLVLVGAVAAAVATAGHIEAIVEFAALAFTATNGLVCFLALRAETTILPRSVPLVGLAGSGLFVLVTLWWLSVRSVLLLAAVVALGICVVGAELLYFDRSAAAASDA
ncbi:MAG: APC family permease [Haloarculaceae archaeon]